MDRTRSYLGNFKQYAFVWRPEFSERRTGVYPSENRIYVEQERRRELGAASTRDSIDTLSKDDIIDRFVENQCQDDPDRYLYRNLQVAEFLEQADMDSLRRGNAREVSNRKILLDDRNNSTVTRDALVGACRQSHGALNAHQLYNELRQPVSHTSPYSYEQYLYGLETRPLLNLADNASFVNLRSFS